MSTYQLGRDKGMQLWLSNKVFEWLNSIEGGHIIDIERVKRPHALLTHCERTLATGDSEFSIADAVLGLKRAINSRLQHIEELYSFSAMFPKSVGALERLERVGLARPTLVKQLLELRNDIEHNDAPPPTQSRAKELIDLTWYFLKTTDPACKLVPSGVLLKSENEGSTPRDLWIYINQSREQRGFFDISGWIQTSHLSHEPQEGFFEIQLATLQSKDTRTTDTLSEVGKWANIQNSARSEHERWISGVSQLHTELQIKVWSLALDAL